MANGTRLTPKGIERKKAGDADVWLSDDEGTRGGGRLVLRISPGGSKLFYFRYSIDGSRKQLPMLPYSKESAPGRVTLEEARDQARRYAAIHRNPETRDVGAYLHGLKQEAEAARLEEERRVQAHQEAAKASSKYTLRALCETYVKHLQTQGKQSANDVESQFRCHVYPSVHADQPANQFTAKQAAMLLRLVVEAGKGRTAGKVRTSLRAAYQLATAAEMDATAPVALIAFGIESNPIASTAALTKFNRARERALGQAELTHVLRRLFESDEPELAVRALRVGLLLGGQRALQLLRVQKADVDLEKNVIRLLDGKGRRPVAREHLLPLNKWVLTEVKALLDRASVFETPWLFASREGKLDSGAMSNWVTELSKEMVAERLSLTPFQFSDLRRTAETLMVPLKVEESVRAQVMSHGLSGVQKRHYDKWKYVDEKRKALRTWETFLKSLLTGETGGNVKQLRPAA
ncbi:tyrosine-type recombinase/integrase [Roseateles sp. P5_E4]